jgi:hypothetical protein
MRPKKNTPAADSHPLNVRIESAMLKSLDAWAARKSRELGTEVNRSDAVRMLIAQGLK